MRVPQSLVRSRHDIQHGGVKLLDDDGHDYFPLGEEPQAARQQEADLPNGAGVAEGRLYGRGNVRWSVTVSRVRQFLTGYTYPYTIAEGVVAADAAHHAQLWLVRHLNALPRGTDSLIWAGVRTWPTAIVQAQGGTDGGHAMVTYTLTATAAAA